MTRTFLIITLLSLATLTHVIPPATAAPATETISAIKDPERRKLVDLVQLGDRTLDPKQANAWAQDGTFQIGANPAVKGPAAIEGFLGGFFGMKLFTKLEHRMVEVVEQRDRLIYQAIAIYTFADGGTMELSYVNWITFKREGKQLKFATYRVFIDASPLMARARQHKP
jgi:hypothetical protein